MILISSTLNDFSTNEVLDWISQSSNCKHFIRINPEDKLAEPRIFVEDSILNVSFVVCINKARVRIDLNRISIYWYRRGLFNCEEICFQIRNRADLDIQNYLVNEWDKVSEFINNRLNEKRKIGNIKDNKINKLEVLVVASRLGIKVPRTIISTTPIERSAMITKGIYNGGFTLEEKYSVGSFTHRVEENRGGTFFPSMFQEEIRKKYELRIFYLSGQFYSSAIFSQGNDKTAVDFRNYDRERPNRVVPYKIPNDIEVKLKNLMDELNLQTGSIDMIVTTEMEFVFLEVNPIGQFNQVSVPCNYFLEKKIADYLMHEN